jgi:hypothetical protein
MNKNPLFIHYYIAKVDLAIAGDVMEVMIRIEPKSKKNKHLIKIDFLVCKIIV